MAILRTGPQRTQPQPTDSNSPQAFSVADSNAGVGGCLSPTERNGVYAHWVNTRAEIQSDEIGKIRYCDDDQKLVDDERYAAIHQSLLAGLLSGVAMAGDKNEYTGGGGLKLFLWPGSGVFSLQTKVDRRGRVGRNHKTIRAYRRSDPAAMDRTDR